MKQVHGTLWCALVMVLGSRADDWQPIVRQSTVNFHGKFFKAYERAQASSHIPKILHRGPSKGGSFTSATKLTGLSRLVQPDDDVCSVYKVSMNQELVYQYIEYQKLLPDLKEFTLCMWSKFHNHSDDHPLFSYSVDDSPKEILSWISNTEQASYISLAVAGHTFFRLNYPLKLNTWYHSCQSWNGDTGEWQVWVNSERVGRGFHNRLVGHVIKGGGSAISGQDQSLLYSNKNGIDPTSKQRPGLMGEITLLQLYHVALTAGKAHKDHKHHHVHHFRHDGTPIEPIHMSVSESPPPEGTPIGNGAFYIGGQLMQPANLNIAGQQQAQSIPVQLPNGLQLQQQYVNGQLSNRVVGEQLLSSVPLGKFPPVPRQEFQFQPLSTRPTQYNQAPTKSVHFPSLSKSTQIISVANEGSQFPQVNILQQQTVDPSKPTTIIFSSSLGNPANVQYIEDAPHNLFRRNSIKQDKRNDPENEDMDGGKKSKRGLVELSDGSIIDEALLHADQDENQALLQQSLLTGLAGFDGNLPVINIQKEQADEREPAEAEVKAVMEICSGCAPEPFKKAHVLSWKSTPKKLYSGAHYYKGLPICKAF